MSGFIEGEDRNQTTLFPERLDDYVAEDNPVRVIDLFIDDLDGSGLGFKVEPAAMDRPRLSPENDVEAVRVRLLEPRAVLTPPGT